MQTQREAPLTRAAVDAFSHELEHLRTVRRREVADQIREAWDSEISKDADVTIPFESAKETQALVEGRIAALEDLLAHATIIDEEAARRSKVVQLGSVVVLENGDRAEHVYQIVGAAESDPAAGKLSHESPVGAALLGRRAGETVEVEAPAGVQRHRIVALR